MSEQDITRYVEALAARVPVSEPPVPAIDRLATRVRRRRRKAAAIATFAATTTLAVGSVVVHHTGGSGKAADPVRQPHVTTQHVDDELVLNGSWVVTALVADDGSNVYDDPTETGPVRLTFEGTTLIGRTECNTLQGDLVQDGRDLLVRAVRSTLVGCQAGASRQQGRQRHDPPARRELDDPGRARPGTYQTLSRAVARPLKDGGVTTRSAPGA